MAPGRERTCFCSALRYSFKSLKVELTKIRKVREVCDMAKSSIDPELSGSFERIGFYAESHDVGAGTFLATR